jgi:hypothetical protein
VCRCRRRADAADYVIEQVPVLAPYRAQVRGARAALGAASERASAAVQTLGGGEGVGVGGALAALVTLYVAARMLGWARRQLVGWLVLAVQVAAWAALAALGLAVWSLGPERALRVAGRAWRVATQLWREEYARYREEAGAER